MYKIAVIAGGDSGEYEVSLNRVTTFSISWTRLCSSPI